MMKFPQLAEANPQESWWLDYPHFYDRARTEMPRMRCSAHGFLLPPNYSDRMMTNYPHKTFKQPDDAEA